MQSGYGRVSEMQHFIENTSSQNPFSISPTQTPSVTASTFHQLIINPFNSHQKPHKQEIMQFPHFHSVPITQQFFTRLPHPQHHTDQHFQHEPENNSRGGIMHPFLVADANDSSGSSIFHEDDASESRFRPWHRQDEDCQIKDLFWRRPADLDCINRNNKQYENNEPGEAALPFPLCNDKDKHSHELAAKIENSQSQPTQLFSELEAIYKPGNTTYITSKQHPESKKSTRKKVKQESISQYFSEMVKKLMHHQEALHQKFVNAIEQRDRERAQREQTFREEELALTKRESAARAKEQALTVARDATIISFVEKITGETLILPSSHNYSHLTTEIYTGDDINAEGSNAATTLMMKNSRCRWPRSEVEALIRVRIGLEWRSQAQGMKGPLWEDVSASMAAQGFQRSAKRCKEKWENINKYFRKAKNRGKKRSQNSKTCPYFQQLDQLYSKSSDEQVSNEKERTNEVGVFCQRL